PRGRTGSSPAPGGWGSASGRTRSPCASRSPPGRTWPSGRSGTRWRRSWDRAPARRGCSQWRNPWRPPRGGTIVVGRSASLLKSGVRRGLGDHQGVAVLGAVAGADPEEDDDVAVLHGPGAAVLVEAQEGAGR